MSTLFDRIATKSKPHWPIHRQACTRIKRALIAANSVPADDPEAAITDALADLRHLCDRLRLDFGALDMMARTHYLAELPEKKGARAK